MFWIAVQGFFFFELRSAWNIVRVIEGKIIKTEWSEGKPAKITSRELAGLRFLLVIEGLSYRGYSKSLKEIQGKSILVRDSERFELARARVIGSRL